MNRAYRNKNSVLASNKQECKSCMKLDDQLDYALKCYALGEHTTQGSKCALNIESFPFLTIMRLSLILEYNM